MANRFVLNGSTFAPGVLAGLTQSQIAGNLDHAGQSTDQGRRVAAADGITAGICAVDGDKPESVCGSKGVLAADQVLKITPPK